MKKRNVLIAALLAVMMGGGIFMSCLSTSEVDQKETEVADTTAETYSFYVKVCSIYGVESLTEKARSNYPNLERDVQAYKQNEQEYLVALGQAKGLQELEKAFLETSLTESEKTLIKEKVVSSVKTTIEQYQEGIVNNLNKYSAENEGIDAFELFKQPDQLNMGIRYNMINCFSLDADNLYIWERDFGLTLADFPVLKAAYDAAEEKARKIAAEEEKNRKLAEATEAEYRELFNKAKEYEEKGQIFYALAYYLDALMVPNAVNEEAKLRFNLLRRFNAKVVSALSTTSSIEELIGLKSSFPKVDPFEQYNFWIALLEDAERYWTEFPPFHFEGTLQRGDLNYENQTASYNLYVDVKYTYKYELLMVDQLIPALRRARRNDWKKIPEDWPLRSIHQEGNTGKHLVNGAALLEDSSIFFNPWVLCYRSGPSASQLYHLLPTLYESVYKYGSGRNTRTIYRYNGSNAIFYNYAESIYESMKGIGYTFYDVKCSIVDNTGEKLLTSKRFLASPYPWQNAYVFENVPKSIMSRIESSEFDIVIDELYLQYGQLNTEKTDRELIKNLKEISIPISNINQKYANSKGLEKYFSSYGADK